MQVAPEPCSGMPSAPRGFAVSLAPTPSLPPLASLRHPTPPPQLVVYWLLHGSPESAIRSIADVIAPCEAAGVPARLSQATRG